MSLRNSLSRRSFLASAAAASPLAFAAREPKKLPLGLELYSVRDGLKQDLMGTVRAVAKLGYDDVEFYAPYNDWTPSYAKDVRKLLDDLGIRCLSTHNNVKDYTPEGLPHAIELNRILGTHYLVMSSAGHIETLDGWKQVAETLNRGAEQMKPAGLRTGYHNHKLEFVPVDGKRPMEVLAANTGKDVMLQFDVGTCVEAGSDPVAWIDANPGRIRSLHLKDWAPGGEDKGYRVLLGEGVVPWKKVFEAAETRGGAEFYLVEQEGSRYSELETAQRCLAALRELRA